MYVGFNYHAEQHDITESEYCIHFSDKEEAEYFLSELEDINDIIKDKDSPTYNSIITILRHRLTNNSIIPGYSYSTTLNELEMADFASIILPRLVHFSANYKNTFMPDFK